MKLVLMVILGAAISLGATFYFQPHFFNKYLNLDLPTPDIIVTSPRSGQEVPLRFTITGHTKVDASLHVLDPTRSEIWQQTLSPGRFSKDVNLILRASPGDRITLEISSSPPNLISIPLILR